MNVLQKNKASKDPPNTCDTDSCGQDFKHEKGDNHCKNASQSTFLSALEAADTFKPTSPSLSDHTTSQSSVGSSDRFKGDQSSSQVTSSCLFEDGNITGAFSNETTMLANDWNRQLMLKIQEMNYRLESQRGILNSLTCQVPNGVNPFHERIVYLQVSNSRFSV